MTRKVSIVFGPILFLAVLPLKIVFADAPLTQSDLSTSPKIVPGSLEAASGDLDGVGAMSMALKLNGAAGELLALTLEVTIGTGLGRCS
jgi:hypothetical protein